MGDKYRRAYDSLTRWAWIVLLCAGPLAAPAFARAGGGHSGGSGGGGILSLILLPFFGIYLWWKNKRIRAKSAEAEKLLVKLAAADPIWAETKLLEAASGIFMAAQKAWCAQDLPALKALLHPDLYAEWEIEIGELKAKGWTNKMDQLVLRDAAVVEVQNFKDDSKDSFSVRLVAAAEDYTVDGSGNIVESNSRDDDKRSANRKSFEDFTEYWTFVRRGGGWLLQRVDDDGDWTATVNAALVDEDAAA